MSEIYPSVRTSIRHSVLQALYERPGAWLSTHDLMGLVEEAESSGVLARILSDMAATGRLEIGPKVTNARGRAVNTWGLSPKWRAHLAAENDPPDPADQADAAPPLPAEISEDEAPAPPIIAPEEARAPAPVAAIQDYQALQPPFAWMLEPDEPSETPPRIICPACAGNDADLPCAFPGEGRTGCLRDLRLRKKAETQQANLPMSDLNAPGAIPSWVLAQPDPPLDAPQPIQTWKVVGIGDKYVASGTGTPPCLPLKPPNAGVEPDPPLDAPQPSQDTTTDILFHSLPERWLPELRLRLMDIDSRFDPEITLRIATEGGGAYLILSTRGKIAFDPDELDFLPSVASVLCRFMDALYPYGTTRPTAAATTPSAPDQA
jgi:hypothetical protein